MKKGIEVARKENLENIKKIVKRLYGKGSTIKEIIEITNLTEEEINKILE